MLKKIVEVNSFDELIKEIVNIEKSTKKVEKDVKDIPKTHLDVHDEILDEIHTMYQQKNERYGNSFSEQFREFGMLSSLIRLTDKLNRLKTLSLAPEGYDTLDESLRDTLLDMANYSILTIMELDKRSDM